jgi:hypothetical protein
MNRVLFLSLILCVLVPRLSFGEDFLVRKDGSSLTQKVHNSDPRSMKAKWWEIHYYWHGRDWGASMCKTYDDLMKAIESGQRIDRIWASATKTDVESFENHMHPGSPIAVVANEVKTDTDDPLHVLDKVHDLMERYNEAVEAYNVLMGNWDKVKVKQGGAMANVGKVFKEYTDNFKDAFRKMSDLQGHLNTLADYSGLRMALDAFESSVSETESSHNSAEQALNAANQPQWSAWQQFPNSSGDLANIFYAFWNKPAGRNVYEHHKMVKNNNDHPIDFMGIDSAGNLIVFSPKHVDPGNTAEASWTDNNSNASWQIAFKTSQPAAPTVKPAELNELLNRWKELNDRCAHLRSIDPGHWETTKERDTVGNKIRALTGKDPAIILGTLWK